MRNLSCLCSPQVLTSYDLASRHVVMPAPDVEDGVCNALSEDVLTLAAVDESQVGGRVLRGWLSCVAGGGSADSVHWGMLRWQSARVGWASCGSLPPSPLRAKPTHSPALPTSPRPPDKSQSLTRPLLAPGLAVPDAARLGQPNSSHSPRFPPASPNPPRRAGSS